MKWKKLEGPETGVRPEFAADWDSLGIDFYEDVPYGTGGDHPMYLDLMLPRGREGKKLPLIIWIHGGGWSIPELTKKYRPTQAAVQACRAGFAFASVEYRLVTEKPFPAPIEDCKCAVRFLRANAEELGLDPGRFGVWGESAGGQLAALTGASWMNADLEGTGGWQDVSSRVQAVCDWYCGGDMTHMGAWKVQEVQDRARALGVTLTRYPHQDSRSDSGGLFTQMFGRPGEEAAELSMAISPIFYVDREQPPYLLMHGDSDQAVPIAFSYDYYNALISHGHDVTFVVVPRQGHGFFKGQGYYDIVVDFFRHKLME
jgi:acetyl esterase/lipase